jgi:hypothetical protein
VAKNKRPTKAEYQRQLWKTYSAVKKLNILWVRSLPELAKLGKPGFILFRMDWKSTRETKYFYTDAPLPIPKRKKSQRKH